VNTINTPQNVSTAVSIDDLFEPLELRSLKVANRFVMSPMTRSYCPGGVPGENVAAYYERRVLGGAGLIITEGVGIDHPAALGESGLNDPDVPHMWGELPLAGWRRVVARVHGAGGKIIPQLWHQGVLRRNGGPFPDAESLRPSGLWGPAGRVTSVPPDYQEWAKGTTRPATDEEIQDVIQSFVRSAVHARDAGFDGIALHGGHGYLLDSFLWHETNKRSAPWGGPDRKARAAMPVAVVKAIRAEIGNLPIFYRFSQWKLQDFRASLATTPDELAELIQPLADAGVDVFDASTRYFDRAEFPEHSPINLAGWAKKLTGKLSMTVGGVGLGGSRYTEDGKRPVLVPGANNLPQLSARFARDEFDLVAVGRALLQDPNWVQKARKSEKFEDYNPASGRGLY
jgi:2,4-dienoyl-CoA reductase-like NADH-dependent reductase (Old Yellow Enzyme family)